MDETRTEKRVAEFDLLLLLSVDERQLRNHDSDNTIATTL